MPAWHLPGSGGTVRVTRRVGEARAKQMIFLGDKIPTDVALSWGLIDKIAEKGSALNSSLELARRLSDCSQSSLELSKIAVRDGAECTEAEALATCARPDGSRILCSRCEGGRECFPGKKKTKFQ